jgi:hypothetical protein
MKYSRFAGLLGFLIFLQSCEFSCQVGNKDEPKGGKAETKDGIQVYNGIKIDAYKVKVDKAYLVFEDGTRVPDDNFVDFSQPIKLQLKIDSGWSVQDGKVWIGASEKIIQEGGITILDEPDMFANLTEGINATDAKSMYLKATIKLKENTPPTSFSVQFRVWDKKSDAYLEGSYMLFSK